MKRLITLCSFSAVLLVWLLFPSGGQIAISSESGSSNGGGNTGSNGDGTTCAQSFCHDDASPQFNSGQASISTTIPASGYVPGQTYTITASISQSGISKFGFELTSETPSGTKIGTLSSTSSETQLTNNNDAVTHTNSGTSGSGSKSWSVDWQAPSSGTGEVIFWAAFNVTNSSSTSTGDTIHLDSTTVQEDTSASAIPTAKMMEENSFSVYPNPAHERISLQGLSPNLQKGKLLLRDLEGRIVKKLYEGELSNNNGRSFDLGADLEAGSYLLELRSGEKRKVEQILVH